MMARRSLLMTTDTVGGVWQYSLDLAAALAPLGIDVLLVTLGPPPGDDQRAQAMAAGIDLRVTDLPLDWLCDGPEPVLAAGAAISALASSERVDLVQLNMPTLGAAPGFTVPVIAVMHGCIATWWEAAHGGALPPEFAWQRALTTRGIAAADAVVAPSMSHARAVQRHYALAATPHAIHNGRPSPASAAAAPSRQLFTAGRLWDRVKDTALLDRVAARVAVPFAAAGTVRGPHGETVAPNNLTLLGQLDAAALDARLAERPVFVSAACFEPFGLAVLEAAAAGCPLVLADIATFRELWDDAALFAPVGDDDAFVDAIERLLADPAQAQRLGDAAMARARRYTPAATAKAMAGLYAQLTESKAAA